MCALIHRQSAASPKIVTFLFFCASRYFAMVSQLRSTGSSSHAGVSKVRYVPFRRCYCGIEAPLSISTSQKNPGRRYFGCQFFPEDEDCGYFEWYDDEVSPWYKELLKEKKKKKQDQIPAVIVEPSATGNENPSMQFLVRVMIALVVLLIVIVGILMWMVLKG